MKRWKYNMESYWSPVKEIINSEEESVENIIKIYNGMIAFLTAWKPRLTKADVDNFESDIDSLIEDLQCSCPDTDDDYESESDVLNCYLEQFYDLCDTADCWL